METFCLGLLKPWCEAGVAATLYTSYTGGEREEEIPDGIEHVSWNLRARKSFWKLAKWLNSRPDDPCLVLSQELAAVLLILKKFRLIRNRIYFRESTDVEHHYGRRFKRLMQWLWPSLDGIIEQSYVGADVTRKICRGRLPKCIVVRNIQLASESNSMFDCPSETFRLSCVGSFKPMKGQRYLVESLAESASDDWQLTFWGNGEKRPDVRCLVNSMTLNDKIFFNEWTSRINDIYSSCDIVVIPSDYEGLPNVMLEAILRGKRVSVRPTCVGACELLAELGIGETWPWRTTMEISADKWIKAQNRLQEICDPMKVATQIAAFMGDMR